MLELGITDEKRRAMRALWVRLDDLGVLPQCSSDPETWWEDSADSAELALMVCEGCPVRAECLTVAEAEPRETQGVWGGRLYGLAGYCPNCGRAVPSRVDQNSRYYQQRVVYCSPECKAARQAARRKAGATRDR